MTLRLPKEDLDAPMPDLSELPDRGSSTTLRHRRSESEASASVAFSRSFGSNQHAPDVLGGSPRWRGGTTNRGGNTALFNKTRQTASTKLFGSGARRRLGSTSSPIHRPHSSHGSRHGRHGWKTNDSVTSAEDDGSPKLVSLSDLIRQEDKVPATLLYEQVGDTDVTMDSWDLGGGLPQQAHNGGTVGVQEALQAAEHGNSIRLSKFLLDGGDPGTVSRLHHMRWSLLHLAAGCATMGGRLSFGSYRYRPEPDCNDGYATCVSELLAAGANPNATSSSRGYTPLMCAALTGSKECCWLLLRAGAQLDKEADDGRTAHDFARNARHVGGAAGGPCERVLAVLQDPPKKVPRSPTLVRATLAEVSCLDSEDAGPPVEVRWRVPSQASLAPASCGDIERYYVKCWWRGKGKEVMRTKTSTVDVPRRDFCRNQIIDRGIALRKNLCLPQSHTASTVVHGLQEGEVYAFTVSCVAEVEGGLRHSPPSCMSKPLYIAESKEDHQWRLGGVLSMVTGKESPSPGGAGDGGVAQTQARRGAEPSPKIVDHRRGHAKSSGIKRNKDGVVPTRAQQQPAASSNHAREEASPYSREGSGRPLASSGHEWDMAMQPLPGPPGRQRSQSQHASTAVKSDPFASWINSEQSSRASLGATGISSAKSSSPVELLVTGENPLGLDKTPADSPGRRREQEMDGGGSALTVSTNRSNRGFTANEYEYHEAFQDEGCSIS